MAWSVSESSEAATRILSLGSGVTARVPDQSLTVHCASLSALIRDIIKIYPGQNLDGSTLVFQQPYAALMHHMSDLETAYADFEPQEKEPTAAQAPLKASLASLLEFLRPKYQACYLPAQERLSQEHPTVIFDDLWVLFRPNSLAFARVNDDHWIGCRIGPTTRLPANIEEEEPERWNVMIWYLQADFSSEEIGCALKFYEFNDFDGEKSPTHFNIVPCQYYDDIDGGPQRKTLEERGQKVLDILWGSSRQYTHSGKSLLSQEFLKADVLVAGSIDLPIGEDSDWRARWARLMSFLAKEDPVYSALERKIHHKRDSRDVFTEDMRFMLSPCLHVLTLWSAERHLVNVDNLNTMSFPDFMPEPVLHQNQLQNLISLVERQGIEDSGWTESHMEISGRSVVALLTGESGVGKRYTASRFIYVPSHLETMVFISAQRGDYGLIRRMDPIVQLAIEISPLDYKRQQKLWLRMVDNCCNQQETKTAITFDRIASSFLSSTDMPKVNWNGHDIENCLQMAVALAYSTAKRKIHKKDSHNIVVEIEHLKQAMNMAFSSRSAIDSMIAQSQYPQYPQYRPQLVEKGVSRKLDELEEDDSSDEHVLDFGRFHEYDELSDDETTSSLPLDDKTWPSVDSSDAQRRKLCIPELNLIEWSTFKTLGTTELFRSKRFYAVDVLVGEPQIWREAPSLLGRKRRVPISSIATQPSAPTTDRQQNTAGSPINSALPERIRINSPAIIEAFQELHFDDSSNLRGAFLMFRPYKVLSYHENALRDWTDKLEENYKASQESPDQADENRDERLQADIAEMKCLLSFIDAYLKEKQRKIEDAHSQSVSYDELWFLFKPGNTVVRNEGRQAYRVARVATTRHRIKERKDSGLSVFKDDGRVEFEQSHMFIKCVHIDFTGRWLGPVVDIFSIPQFKGEKAITSLPIYPIEFSEDPEMSKSYLIERGKVFAKAGSIHHLHYRGLTLPAEEGSKMRDEVDSQVVIDFEEALNRWPDWMPHVRRNILDEYQDDIPHQNEESWRPLFRQTQNTSDWKCIPECCSRETVHHDESIDDKTRTDYIGSQASEISTSTSAAIEASVLSELNDTLKDDDYLIMSYRVFGYVLRSRKWHQLDLADATPPENNSDGFNQLVLPPGHKEVVTSMIAKHFRDRKAASSSHIQTDIVRGKGDLGTDPRAVDMNLEENFSLANRWNCILLIDEADVFLAQRTKEDFVQNSLIAVFLRVMEYYSGVLILTTNRVGVFDEAFTSRIHISLYYPPLDRDQTLEVFKKNCERILTRSKEDDRQIDIDQSEITDFAETYFDRNKQQGRWNGRQIRNAFQSALAMAEFEKLGMDGVNEDLNDVTSDQKEVRTVKLGKKHFEEVAKAYRGFMMYMEQIHGAGDARRARENMLRFDPDDEGSSKRPNALSQRLKFEDDPMRQAPQKFDPAYGPSQYPRGYGAGYENPSSYGPMTPPRGGYPGPHEYQYHPAAYGPRTHGTEQSLYPGHMRASGPSANYQPAQPQPYGTRTHPAPQHEMQPSRSNWDGSNRDTQSGVYSYRPGEQNLGAATGPNIKWGGDAEAGGSQQGP
ncbi:hypothetical protein G7054_g10817 [Neopestalotiopsis clavispora]|nr:hypothetical protein G7054_g10817 [Neopestalotiopsis clavispora]